MSVTAIPLYFPSLAPVAAEGLDATYSLPQTLALVLFGLAGLVALAGLLFWLVARPASIGIGQPGFPVPNLLLGWVMLWLVSAVLLNSYAFPPQERGGHIAQPPGVAPVVAVAEQTDTGTSEPAAPDVETLLTRSGCQGCHTLEGVPGMVGAVGPDLTHVGAAAAMRVQDATYTGSATTPDAYLHEAIVQPGAYVVEGYAPVMPATFESSLKPEEIELLVNYLTSLQ